MDVDAQLAPPVVAVVVAHEPGPWFDEVVAGLAAQDYPNLKLLVLVAGAAPGDDTVSDRVRAVVPGAFVRAVVGNPGFGATANEVLRLVEGQSGFFCFLHDDVALDPSAIRLLVEELYRSNAGIVGPKLVEWDDPGALQHVGLAVDHYAAVDTIVEPGERDQEQHDAVADVFALPSACMLIRADLFRTLGGFDPAIEYHGEDVDLCWRAHLSGARVVVVPSARGRHREMLVERRPDLGHVALRARHRMRAYATLTGAWRAVVRLPLLVLTTLAELLTGIFTGKAGEGTASFGAMLGLIVRLPSVLHRRRMIRSLRVVPDREVAELQVRGSARRIAHRRTRELAGTSTVSLGRRLPEQGAAGIIAAWAGLLVLFLLAARGIISDGSHLVGQMLPYPESGRDLAEMYRSGWWDSGLGQTAAQPTAFGLLAVAAPFVLGHMGLLHTVGILGAVLMGYVGMWRLTSVLGGNRARMVAVVTYAAVPLPYASIGWGRWSAVATYAVVPWALHALRRIGGWRVPSEAMAGPDSAAVVGPVDIVAIPTTGERVRLTAGLVLALAIGIAFSPGSALIVVACAVLWLVATAVVRGSFGAAAIAVAASLVGTVGALVLNLPWALGLLGGDAWESTVGPALASPRDIGVVGILRFEVGPTSLSILTPALFVAALCSILITQGWRLGWAARGASLAAAFVVLEVLDDQRMLPFRLPEPGVMLVPVAVGLALCAGCIVAALAEDVRGARFGLRQPLAILGTAAVVIGVLPALALPFDRDFGQPEFSLAEQMGSLLETAPEQGDYRTLYLGDPRVMPVAARTYEDGIAYALVDDGPLGITDDWAGAPEVQDKLIDTALTAISTRDTARVGRVLAPLSVRYIVVPITDRVQSTVDDPVAPPTGLLDALAAQLDLRRAYTPRDVVVYENMAWIPTRSMLAPAAAAASKEAGLGPLVSTDMSGAEPVMIGASTTGSVTADLPEGTFHLAVPVDDRWTLAVDGEELTGRPAFGYSTAYDLDAPVTATLEYRTDSSRTLWVVVQAALWILVLLATTRVLTRLRRRPRLAPADHGPVLAIDDPSVFDAAPLGPMTTAPPGPDTGPRDDVGEVQP